MKTSERLYNLNRQISMKWIGLKQTPTEYEISQLNKIIGECIKEVRELEEVPKETKEYQNE